ncbi:protein slit-like [Lingula anatina]|uniref:Protein slit-like n=1 Tax=Lingula anatina TaxID=7574 RepID=A0A1S3J9Q1_LINAN|nr:protein slit-like [Lingula anatina]|eukprot:XP_013407048.2 protein slit-like [Lingula anatina]
MPSGHWSPLVIRLCCILTVIIMTTDRLSISGQSTRSCPEVCRCRNERYAGLTTDCSFTGGGMNASVWRDISPRTKKLLLSGNGLSALPRGAFGNIGNLQMLSLSDNKFADLADLVAVMSKNATSSILNMNLAGNRLKYIAHGAFAELTVLESLLLNDNVIEKLEPESMRNTSRLVTLEISGNFLRELHNDTFKYCTNLQHLTLKRNPLVSIDDHAFSTIKHLKTLDLSACGLGRHNITNTFQNLSSLETLMLDNNEISDLPEGALKGTNSLTTLWAVNNSMVKFPLSAIRGLKSLTTLYLSNNKIQVVPANLSELVALKYLYLDDNEIHTFEDGSLQGLHRLTTLWLSRNKISYLPESFQDRFNHLEYGNVPLSKNPMSCDCHMVWFARWVRRKSGFIVPEPVCAEPAKLKGISMATVPLEDMLCSTTPVLCNVQDPNCQKLCGNKTSCFVCPAGSYGTISKDMSAMSCTSCPAFSTSPLGSRSLGDCQCREGYAQNGTTALCTACPKDTYKPTIGPGQCLGCRNGSSTFYEASPHCDCQPGFTLNKNKECTACPENSFKEYPGPGACTVCPAFSESSVASVSFIDCNCTYGEFQSTHQKFGKCQEYVGQEKVLMRLQTPPPGYKVDLVPVINNSVEQRQEPNHTVGMVLGVITGLAGMVILGIMTALFLFRRNKKASKFSVNDLYDEASEPALSIRHHSVDNLYFDKKQYLQWEFPKKNLKIGRILGQGAFGQVHEAWAEGLDSVVKPEKVAVKTLRERATAEEKEALKVELDQMIYVGNHPNVINLLGACTYGGQLLIIMEYAAHGNLLNYLKNKSLQLDFAYRDATNPLIVTEDKDILSFAWQIAKGMSHLESLKCIHRDLAARNILISETMVAKVSDFGLAREAYESGYYFKESKGRLPFRWMSPESLLSGQYTTKSDVWSYGVVLWEMATLGGTPYPGIPPEQMYEMLRSGYRMPRPEHCGQEM